MAAYFRAYKLRFKREAIGLAGLVLLAGLTPVQAAGPAVQATATLPDSALNLPLAFEPNLGQADAETQFLARGPGYAMLLHPQGALLTLGRVPPHEGRATNERLRLEMHLVNSNNHAQGRGRAPLPGRVNYYLGADPARWHKDIPTYERVAYSEVYPGTDLIYYGNQDQIEFDFVLAPQADPARIRLNFDGSNPMRLSPAGDLVFQSGQESISFHRPVAYQEAGNTRQLVQADFDISSDGRVGFRLGPYDKSRPLIIDPVIQYKTYLGSAGADSANAVLTDVDGNRYIAGNTAIADITQTTAFTPRSTETGNKNGGGGTDVYIMKINAAGNSRGVLYTAFFGGPGTDSVNTMTLDGDGNVYIVGDTNSPVLPYATYDHDIGGQDAFVAKLDATGQFQGARYLGGSAQDSGLAITFHQTASAGNEKFLYVAGSTASKLNTNLCNPHDSGSDPLDLGDGYVVKMVADAGDGKLGGIISSVCIGGVKQDSITGIAVNAADEVFFAGSTRSEDLPTSTTPYSSPYQQNFAGGAYDGFAGKLANDGSTLLYLTYLGGTNDDYIFDMVLDGDNNVYVTGMTSSNSRPTGQFTPLPFPTRNPLQPVHGGGTYDAFVTKIDPFGRALVYSTYLGGNGNDQALTIRLNDQRHAWVGGSTLSTNFPLANAWQHQRMGSSDAFVAEVADDGTALKLSSYVGGSRDDQINALAVGKSNGLDRIYVAGNTSSFDLPTVCRDIGVACTDTSVQPYQGADNDAFELDFLAGEAARFDLPTGLATDNTGNIYLADTNNSIIRKISPTGVVTTLAGSAGVPGYADGTGSAARFDHPSGIAIDRNSVLYVADTNNSVIRKITLAGVVTTVAGIPGVTGSSNNTTGTLATFNHPLGIATDGVDNVYVADTGNSLIRKVAVQTLNPPSPVTTVAGIAGTTGSADNSTGALATFNHPTGLTVNHNDGNIYVADTDNSVIRRISNATTNKPVTTLAGTAGTTGSTDGTGSVARFNFPRGIDLDSTGTIYVADTGNSTLRKVTVTGVVTTLAGIAGTTGSVDGTLAQARFNAPRGVALDSFNNLYVADAGNSTLRKITTAGAVTTLSGTVGVAGHTDGFGIADAHHPDIGISIADMIGPIEVVNTYVYDITVSNNSDADATGVVVFVRMENAVLRDATGNDASGNPEHCLIEAATAATCNVGNIAAGHTAPVTVLALPNALGKAAVTVEFVRANQSVDSTQGSASETTLIIDSSGGYGEVSWDFYLLTLLGWAARRLMRPSRTADPLSRNAANNA